MPTIAYRVGNDIPLDKFIDLYRASTLGLRRPVDRHETMAAMLQHANLIVSAWHEELLVGLARTLTDFLYVGYLADLAVHQHYQRQGIGVELIKRSRLAMGPASRIVLLAAPAATEYYPRVGFTQHPQAWVLAAQEPFPAGVS